MMQMKNEIPLDVGSAEKQCPCGRQHPWEDYENSELCDCGRRLFAVNQDWLDANMYSEPADLEPELNRLADDAGNLADCEHSLIEAIKEKKRQLEFLPDIIRFLENKLRGLGDDLAETLEHYDRLAEAHKFLSAKQQQPEVEA